MVSSSVRILAQALVHIEQGIERRFLKAPLGESLSRPVKIWNSLEKITHNTHDSQDTQQNASGS